MHPTFSDLLLRSILRFGGACAAASRWRTQKGARARRRCLFGRRICCLSACCLRCALALFYLRKTHIALLLFRCRSAHTGTPGPATTPRQVLSKALRAPFPEAAAQALADAAGVAPSPPCLREWLMQLLRTGGGDGVGGQNSGPASGASRAEQGEAGPTPMVDSFAFFHPGAAERFTAWDQVRPFLYSPPGIRSAPFSVEDLSQWLDIKPVPQEPLDQPLTRPPYLSYANSTRTLGTRIGAAESTIL